MLADSWNTLDPEMNDHKSSLPDGPRQGKGAVAPVSLSRRRFAKGAAPVVLGSLISKPVLGAEYICTLSGNASGNASARLIDDAGCKVGKNEDHWLTSDWTAYIKGETPVVSGTTCSFGTTGQGTLFRDVMSGQETLANVFFYRSATQDNPCRTVFDLTPGSNLNSRPASLYQVLARTGNNEQWRLGRATVVSLLNAAEMIDYPIAAWRIIEMFNAVKGGGTSSYQVGGTNVKLFRLGVIEYFESLYL